MNGSSTYERRTRATRLRTGTAETVIAALMGMAAAGCGNTTGPNGGPTPQPTGFVQVATGQSHSCALRSSGEVLCWGRNAEGQLGDGNPGPGPVATPVVVQTDLEFVAIVAGGAHTCALASAGEAYCWGSDSDGQLGHGPNSVLGAAPTPVAGSDVFTDLTAGDAHTCGLSTSGGGLCWGANGNGQLGNGNGGTSASTPGSVQLMSELVAISAGSRHTCAVKSDGAALCWGNNGTAQLGDGTTTDRDAPVSVGGGLAFGAVAGGGVHSCALTGAGAAHCWGFNLFGQLGDGTNADRNAPSAVDGALAFERLSAGSDHTCGLTGDGEAFCWGFNGDGRVGDGSATDRNAPTAVSGGLEFVDIDAGGVHSCGVTAAGDVYCWGVNDAGQLGDGTTENRLSPVEVIVP